MQYLSCCCEDLLNTADGMNMHYLPLTESLKQATST